MKTTPEQHDTQAGIWCPTAYQTDPTRVSRLAIVTASETHAVYQVFSHRDPRRAFNNGVTHVAQTPLDLLNASAGELAAQLAELAVWQEVGAVWLLPTAPRTRLRSEWPAIAQALLEAPELAAHEVSSDGQLAGVTFRRRGGSGQPTGPSIGVYAPWVNNAWGFWPLLEAHPTTDARTLAEGLALAAFSLGVALHASPSNVGLTLLRQELQHWEARNGVLPPLSPAWRERLNGDPSDPEDAGMKPAYAIWRPEAISETVWNVREAARLQPDMPITLYSYDRNSSFVSSAREVGVGDPLPVETFQPKRPGVYWVTGWEASYLELFDGRHPGPFHSGDDQYPLSARAYQLSGGGVWAWEPQIRFALEQGYEVEVSHGVYWPKRGDLGPGVPGAVHDLFRPWQQRLWDARRVARGWGAAGALAVALIKLAGVSAIGRLVHRRHHVMLRTAEARARGLRIYARQTDASGELTGLAEVEAPEGRTDLLQPGWWSTIIANANERLWTALARTDDCVLAYVDGFYTLSPYPQFSGPRDTPGGWRAAEVFHVPAAELAGLLSLPARELVKALATAKRETGVPARELTSVTAPAVEGVARG